MIAIIPNRILLSLVTVAVSVSGGLLNARAESADWETTHAISADGTVSVENVNGSITIKAWDQRSVKIEARKEGKTKRAVADTKIEVDAGSDRVSVQTKLPKYSRGWFRGSSNEGAKVSYTVYVPASARLKTIRSVNGSIKIEGVHGGVEARTVNGGITATDVDGRLNLSTVNGSIECAAAARFAAAPMEFSTVNGGIELSLPASVDLSLKAGTVNGSIKSELDLSNAEYRGRRSLRADLGQGGEALELETVNGSIRILKLASAGPVIN